MNNSQDYIAECTARFYAAVLGGAEEKYASRISAIYCHANETQRLIDGIDNALRFLSFREREILKCRYGMMAGYDYTREEVGRIFKVSSERIRQIEKKALNKVLSHSKKELEALLD